MFLYDDRIRAALGGLLAPFALLTGRPPSWAGEPCKGLLEGRLDVVGHYSALTRCTQAFPEVLPSEPQSYISSANSYSNIKG